jgi:hypothetical protein
MNTEGRREVTDARALSRKTVFMGPGFRRDDYWNCSMIQNRSYDRALERMTWVAPSPGTTCATR